MGGCPWLIARLLEKSNSSSAHLACWRAERSSWKMARWPVRGPGADILGGSGAGEGGWFHHAVLQAERSMALAWAVPSLGDCLRLTVLHPWASPGDRRTDNPPAVSRSRCYTSSLDVYPKQMTGLLEWQETFGLVLPNPHRLFTDRETEVQRGVLTLIPSPLPPQGHSL